MHLDLSIIIVNYNGLKYFKECFDSIAKNLEGVSYEIIVIDNASKDLSIDYIRINYPEIKLIVSKENLGFGKGNNEAVKQAKGSYLLLLNNDTILLDQIKYALDILKSDKSIGVIGINMLNKDMRYIHAAGNFPSIFNLFWMKYTFKINKDFIKGNFSKESYQVDWLTGSFLLLSKSTYKSIGGFDEDYFLYVEDVDFCKKIQKIGLKRVFIPSIRYIHFVGFNKNKNPLLIKGYKKFIQKHYSGFNYFLCKISLNINAFVKKVKSF